METLNKEVHEAQKRFDEMYISSTQMTALLNVNRASIFHARQRGVLPEPIIINEGQVYLWERSVVDPILKEWKQSLDFRRGVKNVAA